MGKNLENDAQSDKHSQIGPKKCESEESVNRYR